MFTMLPAPGHEIPIPSLYPGGLQLLRPSSSMARSPQIARQGSAGQTWARIGHSRLPFPAASRAGPRKT
jgi:hypothetical protein